MDNILVAFDLGTSQIKGVVAKKEGESFEILSAKSFPSFGIRRGMIVNPEAVSKILKELKKELEHSAGIKIDEAAVNIGGHHIFSKEVKGAIAISRADQKVSQEDIDRVIEEASKINLPLNKEIIEVYPKNFILDGEGGIKNPLNLKGIKLEVEGLAVCAFSPYIRNLENVLDNAQIQPLIILPSPLASAESTLTDRQKELGVALVEIGAGTIQMAVFEEDALIDLAIFPLGSLNITNDIAVALQTEIEIANKIKEKFGELAFKSTKRTEKLQLKDGEEFHFSTKKLSKAIKARIEEIIALIKNELKRIDKIKDLPGGIVLTGGGAKLKGLVEYTKKSIALPVRKAKPTGFSGYNLDEEWATVCGLLKILDKEDFEEERKNTFFQKIKKVLKFFVP